MRFMSLIVQKGLGGIRTSLLPGRYYIGIHGLSYPIDLKESVVFDEPPMNDLESDKEWEGKNIDKDTITLEYFISHRICPICNSGILLGRRDNETLEMLKTDNCIQCHAD
jgi:hypothetical protein